MKKIYLLLIVNTLTLIAVGQEATLSLDDAKNYALKNNTDNIKSEMDVKIAKKKVAETRAIGLPQVVAEGNLQKFLDIPVSLAPANAFNPLAPEGQLAELQFGLEYNNNYGISASQLIFDGSYIVGLQAAKTYKEISINNQVKTEIQLLEEVTQAYFTVLIAKENTEILSQTLNSTEKILMETEALYEVGLTEEQNVEQLTLNVNEIKTQLGIAKGQINFAEKLLKLKIGMDIDSAIILSDNIEGFITGVTPLNADEFNVNNHIDFQMMENNARLMKLNLRKEKYSFLPSVNLFFNHQQQNMNNEFDALSGGRYYPSTVLGAKLTLPILTSGSRLAKMSQAKIELEKSELDVQQVEQNLLYQSQLAQSNYETDYEVYLNQKENMELSKKIYDKTINKYKEGMASSLELSQTQNQYLSAEGKYIRSILDVLKSKSQLKLSYGSK